VVGGYYIAPFRNEGEAAARQAPAPVWSDFHISIGA